MRRSLEQESDLAQTELEQKHQEIINQLKEEHERQLKGKQQVSIIDQLTTSEALGNPVSWNKGNLILPWILQNLSIDSIRRELEQQQGLHAETLLAQKLELESTLESLKMEFETSQDAMADEHAEALSKLEV